MKTQTRAVTAAEPRPKKNVRKKSRTEKRIDKTIEDSFPASDPPQWDSVSHKKQ